MMSAPRLLLALLGVLVGVGSLAQASFRIELHNGREVRTSQVWDEGTEVKFVTPQGTMGLPKALIKSITAVAPARGNAPQPTARHEPPDVDRAATRARAEAHPPASVDARRDGQIPPSPPEPPPTPATQTTGGRGGRHAADAEAERAKKRHLMQQLNEATATYLASSAAKNVEAKQAALSSMRAFSTQIIDLEADVKRRHGGVLPPWWAD